MHAVFSATHRAAPKPLDASAADGLAPLLAAHARAWRKALRRARHEATAAAVHDLRVESRRMLAVLQLVAAVVPDAPQRRIRRGLKRRLKVLSRLRDADVQLGLLAAAGGRDPRCRAFTAVLERERRRLAKQAIRRLRRVADGRIDRRLAQLRRAVQAVIRKPRRARRAAAAMQQAAARAQACVNRRRGRADPARPESLHRLRVALKKARYLSEALAQLHPEAGGASITEMRAQQRLLGGIHDLDVLLERLAEFRFRPGQVHADDRAPEPLQRRRRRLMREFLTAAARTGRSAAAAELD